jgi:hypothetical protein
VIGLPGSRDPAPSDQIQDIPPSLLAVLASKSEANKAWSVVKGSIRVSRDQGIVDSLIRNWLTKLHFDTSIL